MHLRKLISGFALAGLTILGASACDDHDYETYVADLTGGGEFPVVNTTSSGRAVLLLSKDESRIDISVQIDKPLSSALRFSHIHRGPAGGTGPVIYNLWVPGSTPTEPFDVGSPIGRTLHFTAQDLADLRAGNLYVNVHSVNFGSGEIRGQLRKQ